jgi:hypothetical protein
MFELTEYISKTKSLNEELVNSYGVEIFLKNEHMITLENKNCKVEFVTGKYYLDFLFFISTHIDNKKYGAIELFEKENIIVKDVLSDLEQFIAKGLTDDIERYIYIYSIIIQKKLLKYF